MADFSHSVQRTQASATLSKKISSNGNGFTAKTVYDDVFGGPPKFCVPTFSSGVDDYNEIFGCFQSSRVSSIPILDLPIVDESDFSIDVRNSKFDYSEVFGGFNGLDFAVSYEELLAEPKGGEGGESSSDDVWTSAETGSPSEGSSEDPVCSEINQAFSNEESYQPLDGSKQFNMLYHKTNQISREDGISATTHIAELNSVPAFTFVVDESVPSQKAETDKTMPQVTKLCSQDVDFSGRVMEGKHLMETTSEQPVYHTVTEISESDLKHQRNHLKENVLHQPVCHTVTQISETDLKHKKTPNVNETYPGKAFVTVSEINLRTLPTHVPPPSRPPPKLSIKQGDSKRLMASNLKASERAVSDGSPPFFDVEVDASSSAAASAAAMKEAMEKAQARLKSAKESMERKRDGLQNRKKLGLKKELKVEEKREGEEAHEAHWLKKKAPGTFETVDNDMKGFSAEERQKATREVKVAPDFQASGKLVNASKELVEKKHREEYRSTQESRKREEGTTGEWKVEEQYYELVQTDNITAGMEDLKRERMEDLVSTQRVQECRMKAAKVAFNHQEKNDRQSKTVKEVCRGEKDRSELEVAEEACQWEEHEKKIKAVQELQEREEYAKELNAAQEVRDWEENEKKFKVELEGAEHDKKEKVSPGLEEYEKKLKESCEREEHVKQLKQAREREEYEMKMKKSREQEENEKKQKEAREHEENEKREKMAREREENEKRLKEAREQEEKEKKLKEAREQEAKEKRLKEAREQEENEKRLKEAREQEENEKRLKEAHEREENEKRQNEAREREENAKRLKEAHEREARERKENEKRLKEDREREENEKRLNEAREREENERRLKEAREREENEKKLKEAREREEKERRIKEARSQEENERRQQERKSEDNEKKLKAAQETLVHREDERNLKASKESLESAESEKKLKLANEVCKQDEDKKLNATQEACKQEQDTNIFELAQISCEREEIGKTMESAKCASENGRELQAVEKVLNEQDGNYRIEVEHVDQSTPEHEDLENKKKVASEAKLQDNEKYLGEPQAAVLQEKNERNKKPYQGARDQEENKNKYNGAQGKELVENGKKIEAAHPTNVVEGRAEKLKLGPGVNISQDTERRENLSTEEKEKEERMQREREREKERLRKVEEDREREREREKDRMAVERATREARERAFADARERAERAAVERATAEARQRAMAEARERLEKASAEAREKSLVEKASIEARLRAERAAVERATTEARERAAEKAKAEKAAFGTRERAERTFSEKFSSTSRDSGMRQSSSYSDLRDSQFQSSGPSSSFQRYPSSSNLGASYVSEKYQGTEIESAQRCKARLERHQRTVERAAKALAEKNMRDLLTQREQAERNRLAETLDAEVRRWSNGKEGNLRALLSTLQYILGPESGWHPIPLTEVITAIAVKKAYRKATLCVHPDKLQQRGASIQQKYICEKVFDLLKEAWNKFNSEER